MKQKDFEGALALRGSEFGDMLHAFRAVASLAELEPKVPEDKVSYQPSNGLSLTFL